MIIERLFHPRVLPLEACSLAVGDKVLGNFVDSDLLSNRLFEAALLLQRGEISFRDGSKNRAVEAAFGFDRLVVSGGRADRLKMPPNLPFKCELKPDSLFQAEAGAQTLALPENNWTVIDFGQSQLKLSFAGKRFIVPRDFTALPSAQKLPPASALTFRPALRRCLAESLRRGAREASMCSIDTLVLALPCEVGPHLEFGWSSYPGLEGDITFIEDAIRSSGISVLRVLVGNDGEAAAFSLLQSDANETKVLITLGYGIGGAVVLREDSGL